MTDTRFLAAMCEDDLAEYAKDLAKLGIGESTPVQTDNLIDPDWDSEDVSWD